MSSLADHAQWIADTYAERVEREIDCDAFERWWSKNDYQTKYPIYSKTYPTEKGRKYKAFEHWISLQETAEIAGSVSMDVACATSPFHNLVEETIGGTCYRQDLPLP
jgi:hypothetical protein